MSDVFLVNTLCSPANGKPSIVNAMNWIEVNSCCGAHYIEEPKRIITADWFKGIAMFIDLSPSVRTLLSNSNIDIEFIDIPLADGRVLTYMLSTVTGVQKEKEFDE